jgi:hypothetical protein
MAPVQVRNKRREIGKIKGSDTNTLRHKVGQIATTILRY